MTASNRESLNKILSIGRSLESIGDNNWGFTRSQALDVIPLIEAGGFGILGGDVYVIEGDIIRPCGDNWSCDPKPNEDGLVFAARSAIVAREYIEKYPTILGHRLFTFVPSRIVHGLRTP